jgi:hypothetical protein
VTGKTWYDSITYCNVLSYGGHDDWRLPNLFEWASLVNRQKANPATDIAKFPGTPPSGEFWESLDATETCSGCAALITFTDGDQSAAASKLELFRARCVRGGKMSPAGEETERFIVKEPVAGQKVVSDAVTGLSWQRSDDAECAWKVALSTCAKLTYGGYSDWRAPNANELSSLLNCAQSNPETDFPLIKAWESIWSSSTSAGEKEKAWYVDFVTGSLGNTEKNGGSKHAGGLCVRGGP